jgi:hypothetical protein
MDWRLLWEFGLGALGDSFETGLRWNRDTEHCLRELQLEWKEKTGLSLEGVGLSQEALSSLEARVSVSGRNWPSYTRDYRQSNT